MRPELPLGRWSLFAVAGAVVLIDQLSKLVVRNQVGPGASIPILSGIFHLTYVRNPGAAFGMLPGKQLFFFATTGVVIGFIVVYYLRSRPTDPWLVAALGLELGGATGNLIDRLMWGRVTDFLDFRFWPVFNLADSSIVIGLALVLLVAVRHSRQEASKQEAA